MAFRRGEEVEVSSKVDGFLGSFYAATVLAEVGRSHYIVQYKNLLKDEESGPLIEIVAADEVRPVPPAIPAPGFGLYEKVDAFDNDGWWVGENFGKSGSKCRAYFYTTGDEIAYSPSQLRVHVKWLNHKWIASKKRVQHDFLWHA